MQRKEKEKEKRENHRQKKLEKGDASKLDVGIHLGGFSPDRRNPLQSMNKGDFWPRGKTRSTRGWGTPDTSPIHIVALSH